MVCWWRALPLMKTNGLHWSTAIGRYKTNGLRPAPYVQQDLRRQHPGDSTLVLTHAVRTDINTALTEAWSTARTWIQGSLAGESVMAALWVHDPAVVALPRDQAGRESRLILELKLRVDAGEMPWTRGVPWGVEPVSMSVLGMAAERRRLLTDCAVRTLLAHDPVTVACGVLAGAINITAASQWP